MSEREEQDGILSIINKITYTFSLQKGKQTTTSDDHFLYFGDDLIDDVTPKYQNIKSELINSDYFSIATSTWNNFLRKSAAIHKGTISLNVKHEKWIKILPRISTKNAVTLALYTNLPGLQEEFCQAFDISYNNDNNNKDTERLASIYYTGQELKNVFELFSDIPTVIDPPTIPLDNEYNDAIHYVLFLHRYQGIFIFCYLYQT